MMDDLRLTLPLPPSVNHCYRNVLRVYRDPAGKLHRQRRRVLTRDAQLWHNTAHRDATRAADRAGWETQPNGVKVYHRLMFYWPDRRRRDTHNLHKLLFDALEGALYADDAWALVDGEDFDVDRADPRLEIVASLRAR